eukprot:6794474-Alexandrium_andersonii.AAC.1
MTAFSKGDDSGEGLGLPVKYMAQRLVSQSFVQFHGGNFSEAWRLLATPSFAAAKVRFQALPGTLKRFQALSGGVGSAWKHFNN